jgi:hypothetical protein
VCVCGGGGRRHDAVCLGENIFHGYIIIKPWEFHFITDQLISKNTLKAYIKLIQRLNFLINALIELGLKDSGAISKRFPIFSPSVQHRCEASGRKCNGPHLRKPETVHSYLKWYKDCVELYL